MVNEASIVAGPRAQQVWLGNIPPTPKREEPQPEPEPEPEPEVKQEPEPETHKEPEPETYKEPEPKFQQEPEPETHKPKKLSVVAATAKSFLAMAEQNKAMNEKLRVKNSQAHKIATPTREKKIAPSIIGALTPPPPPAEEVVSPTTPVRQMKREFSIQVNEYKKRQDGLKVRNSVAATFHEEGSPKSVVNVPGDDKE
mmetsp:Transcript_11937/g.17396  ORF Transcript_11937/g.17396 Transcript_11937/m.17396 type:complete len:198 (+) Transcript_11937:129-722(+)